MATPTIVNKLGTMVGWGKVSVRILGRDLIGIRKIAYSDEQEMDNEYASGNMPVGQSEGNYKAEASMELTKEEVLGLQAALGPDIRMQDIVPFPVVVTYKYKGKVYKDIIQNCRFTNTGTDVKQGDKTISTDFKLLTTHITYGA